MNRGEGTSRRKVLTVTGTGLLVALAGCSTITGSKGEAKTEEPNPPKPVIVEASAEIENFRQTESKSKTLFILQNKGGLAEFKATVQAKGEVAIFAEDSELFSLQKGQEYQLGFDLFTHSGAEEMKIIVEPTDYPELTVTHSITEEGTPNEIDYEGS